MKEREIKTYVQTKICDQISRRSSLEVDRDMIKIYGKIAENGLRELDALEFHKLTMDKSVYGAAFRYNFKKQVVDESIRREAELGESNLMKFCF